MCPPQFYNPSSATSRNAPFYLPDLKRETFFCPVCQMAFDRTALEGRDAVVKVAHVYPRGCGGKVETLTCKACNDRARTRYDSQLVKEHRNHGGFRPGSTTPCRTRVAFDGGSVAAALTREGGGFHLKVLGGGRRGDEEALEALIRQGPGVFHVLFDRVDDFAYRVALLHAACLALVREYGYEHVAFFDADWIRAALTAPAPPEQLRYFTMTLPGDAGFPRGALHGTGVAEHTGVRTLAVAVLAPERRDDVAGVA